jgi:hypothetical protein
MNRFWIVMIVSSVLVLAVVIVAHKKIKKAQDELAAASTDGTGGVKTGETGLGGAVVGEVPLESGDDLIN